MAESWETFVGASSSTRINRLLTDWGKGDDKARDELIPVLYDELRKLARHYLWRERPDHTLQSAALVNEAYLRLVRQDAPQWQNRTHFFAVAAQLMRHILVDHARGKRAAKRGAGASRISFDAEIALPNKPALDLLALDTALNKLTALDAQQSRLVELRFFGGLSIEETAAAMGISPATVKREWTSARAWLLHELKAQRE